MLFRYGRVEDSHPHPDSQNAATTALDATETAPSCLTQAITTTGNGWDEDDFFDIPIVDPKERLAAHASASCQPILR